jgi:hypothetical protein
MNDYLIVNWGEARQTVSIKVLPCTNTLPTRLKASTSGGSMSLIRSIAELEHEYKTQDMQSLVCLIGTEVLKKMNWTGQWAIGATKDGWVLVNTKG